MFFTYTKGPPLYQIRSQLHTKSPIQFAHLTIHNAGKLKRSISYQQYLSCVPAVELQGVKDALEKINATYPKASLQKTWLAPSSNSCEGYLAAWRTGRRKQLQHYLQHGPVRPGGFALGHGSHQEGVGNMPEALLNVYKSSIA